MELMMDIVILGCLIVFPKSLVECDTIKTITKIGAKMLATTQTRIKRIDKGFAKKQAQIKS